MVAWFAERKVDALGIGAFGPTGVSPASPDYGGYLETPKTAWRHFDLSVRSDRSAFPWGTTPTSNAACLGEVTFGAARGLDNVVYVTIGTGIGAGVMVGGQLLHGMLHAEAGHILLPVEPGDEGNSVCPYHPDCFEGLASGPSIAHRWGAKGSELADRDEVWDLESTYIARGMEIYIACYSPQMIILGGGVMKQTQLFAQVRQKTLEYLNGYLVSPELADIDGYIVEAGCKGDQGVLGCIELGRRALMA